MLRSSYLVAGLVWTILGWGCGGPARTGTRPDSPIGRDPLSQVEVVISGLSRSDAEAFRGQILAQGDISDVVLKSYAEGVATYTLDVRGCECDLPAKIDRIHSPGFKYEGRSTTLRYAAFDNQPPVVTFVHPEKDRTLREAEQLVAVDVRDSDIAEVRVNGVKAERYRGDVYLAKIRLQPGKNEIIALAKDRAGHETPAKLTVIIDDPATAAATRPFLVEGKAAPGSKVLVDGKEIAVSDDGQYREQVPVKKGQKQIEIIVIAPDGRKAVTVKDLPE